MSKLRSELVSLVRGYFAYFAVPIAITLSKQRSRRLAWLYAMLLSTRGRYSAQRAVLRFWSRSRSRCSPAASSSAWT